MVPERTEEVERSEASFDNIQRWTAKWQVAVVLSLRKGVTAMAEEARKHGLTVAEVEDWLERVLLGAENAVRSRPKEEDALKDEPIKKLKHKIGELALDNDVLREALRPYPLARGTFSWWSEPNAGQTGCTSS